MLSVQCGSDLARKTCTVSPVSGLVRKVYIHVLTVQYVSDLARKRLCALSVQYVFSLASKMCCQSSVCLIW